MTSTSVEEVPAGSVSSRATWLLIDQGANSLFSLGAGLAAAQLLDLNSFGTFAAIFAAYLATRDLLRALVIDPMIIRHSGVDTWSQRREVYSIVGGVGVFAGLVALIALTSFEIVSAPVALAILVGLAPLLLTDALRGVAMALGQPRTAARLSATLVASFGVGAALFWIVIPGLAAVVLAVSVAGLVAVWTLRTWMAPPVEARTAWRWLTSHLSIGTPLTLDYLASAGVTYGAVFVLASQDLAESAALRGAQMIAAPMFLLFVAAVQFILAEEARRKNRVGAISLRLPLLALGAMLILGGIYWIVVVIAEPVVVRLLGDSGQVTVPVINPMMLFALTAAPGLVVSAVLRAKDQAMQALAVRLATSVFVVPAILYGAFSSGAAASMRYGGIAQLATMPILVLTLWSVERTRGAGQ